jgi:starch-binding outer membrane protein, SusD/RagB family
MLKIKSLFIGCVYLLLFSSCKKLIDVYPQSNLSTATFYNNAEEVQTGLNGCYNSLQRAMLFEWQLTELRSDNTKMGVPASSNTVNRDLSDLDVFIPSTGHPTVNSYWTASYNTIRNANIILQKLGVAYDAGTGSLSLSTITTPISDSLRKQYAGEAMVLRAHAYFNLVRLYGGVFLIYTPVTADEAKTINRSSVDDIYKLIKADLTTAAGYLSSLKFVQTPAASIGRVNAWVAKGLLAKVHLTLNDKASAIPLLQDVITNSGYSLQTSYANVFSITNEMNSEIMFAVRYKAGNLGLGSSFGNDFAPLGSGSAVINGSGLGWNYPTNDIDTAMGITTSDPRKATSIGVYTTSRVLYVKKYLTPVVTTNDGESDVPVLRFADIILMLAEAQGFTPASITLINQIRIRAGLMALPASVNTVALFEQALANERRFEFLFENHRFFDLVRFNSTLTTITAEQVIKDHITKEFARHYALYNPVVPLNILLGNVTANKLLLPIPQREIDTNTQLSITQNPGY